MTSPARRVLVLEDEFFIADEISWILESAGFEVVGPVATVDDAMAELGRASVDAAVIDANLRGVSSAPVAEALRHENIPFLVCSGYRSDDLTPSFGPINLVAKPVQATRLLTALGSLLAPHVGEG